MSIEIVGEDLHPLAQVRDFAPYIAKIKASGADSVITGNWGSDLALLVKAANEAGYNGDVELRKADHQMQQGLYITRWEKASAKYPYSPENTGYTLAPVKFYDAYVASTPTTCQMKRPGQNG